MQERHLPPASALALQVAAAVNRRAVAGLPLGDGKRYADVVMENLIGDDIARVPQMMASPGVQLHLYGKGEAKPGRKMGHVNRIVR